MAKESLASKQQSSALTVVNSGTLPALFKNDVIEITPTFSTPFLVFAQPAAKEQWKTLVTKFPTIEDGDPVLMFPDPEPAIKLDQIRCTVMKMEQYFATRDLSRGGVEKDRFKKPGPDRAERLIIAMIIYLNDRAVPCTCIAKTVKCAAFHDIYNELKRMSDPEKQLDWVKQSASHKLAWEKCDAPFARITATISIRGGTGRGSGMAYAATKVSITPSTQVEWDLLAKIDMKELKKIAEAYNAKVSGLGVKQE